MRTTVATTEENVSARGLRVGLVVSRFNSDITQRLEEGAHSALAAMGATADECPVYMVAGAFEIPVVTHMLAESGRVDGIVCLGCLIRGETDHYDHVSRAAADGIAQVALATGVPIGFGILTVQTRDQALDRAGGRFGNMGDQTARAVVDAILAIKSIG